MFFFVPCIPPYFPFLVCSLFPHSYSCISLLCSPPPLPSSVFLPEEVETAASHRLYPTCASSPPRFLLLRFFLFAASLFFILIRHFTSSLASFLPFTPPDPPTSLFKHRRAPLYPLSYLKFVLKGNSSWTCCVVSKCFVTVWFDFSSFYGWKFCGAFFIPAFHYIESDDTPALTMVSGTDKYDLMTCSFKNLNYGCDGCIQLRSPNRALVWVMLNCNATYRNVS